MELVVAMTNKQIATPESSDLRELWGERFMASSFDRGGVENDPMISNMAGGKRQIDLGQVTWDRAV